jgi:hypothetical protein
MREDGSIPMISYLGKYIDIAMAGMTDGIPKSKVHK